MKQIVRFFGADAPVMIAALLCAIAFPLLLATTPAAAQSGDVYREIGAQVRQDAQFGVVVGLREVRVQPSQFAGNAGAVAGGGLGAAVFAHLAKNADPAARAALALVGGTLGGFGGKAVTDSIGADRATEILVQLSQNGYGSSQVMAVVQPNPAPNVQVGQQVIVLNDRGQNRVIPAYAPAQPQVVPQSLGHPQQGVGSSGYQAQPHSQHLQVSFGN